MKKGIKIGTRGSLLALAQAKIVQKEFERRNIPSELVIIKTLGDQIQDRRLADIGGKALFTKEIERALLEETIDVAVHSMKDVETRRPLGLSIGAILKREDPRDAFLSRVYPSVKDLPPGVRIGTCAPRRAAQILAQQPLADIVLFRGNIHTRLEKLARGEVDVTFLALAGLKRAGLEQEATEILAPDIMLPAAGQGAIGIEFLDSRQDLQPLLASMSHQETYRCVMLERCYLSFLEGNCHTPVGALALEKRAEGKPKTYLMRTFVAQGNGTRGFYETFKGSYEEVMQEAEIRGKEAKKWLFKKGG